MDINTEQQATDNLAVVIERLTNIRDENVREHATIIEQVKKTNGTVADLVRWKERMLGAIVIMNVVIMPIIVAVLIKFVVDNLF
jgi:hypothetical protein